MLERIKSPTAIRKLKLKELHSLCSEIREYMIRVITEETGGHLASSLGVVELTVALHYVFNTPKDKLIWDVGHQCYPHKLLTNRYHRFHTLRQYGGISGFISPEESPYDSFYVGHAGTSISLAEGVAAARDILKKDYRVITVTGDASISSGMAFEAVNHIGHMPRKGLIIILNDNEMSISKNVGGLSRYLNRLITLPVYNKFKNRTYDMLRKLPFFGKGLCRISDKIQEILKSMVLPAIIFEELGLRYIGPIDGHNLERLVGTFRKTEFMQDRPLLIHVITKKGKGFEPAENNPTDFHGVARPGKKSISFTGVFSDTIVQLAGKDKKIAAITAAMAPGTGLKEFSIRFPDRFFDVGIAEQHAVTLAAGLADQGLKPFVAIYSTFLQRGYDQLIHDVALPSLPVRFIIDRAGIVGDDGPTHNGIFDLSFLSSVPNLTILSPADEKEFRDMIVFMADWEKGPIAVRFPRGNGPGIDLAVSIQSARLLNNRILRRGKDAVILTTGPVAYEALKTAQLIFRKTEYNVSVIDCRCIKPLDKKNILQWAEKTSRVLTVEENVFHGGFGSAVNDLLCGSGKTLRIRNIALPDKFIEAGSQNLIRKKYGLDSANIYKECMRLFSK